MSEILEFNKQARVRDEASIWLARIQEPLSAERQQELLAWLAQDKAHERELLELATVWDELEVLSELAPLFESVSLPLNQSAQTDNPSSSWAPLGIAASIFVTLGLAVYFFSGVSTSNERLAIFERTANEPVHQGSSEAEIVANKSEHQSFKTSIGEQLELRLADGSIATLNTDTHIVVNFSATQRTIRLLQGEAHFDVFKDPTRPLKVLVSGKSVKAIGTAFSVRKKSGSDIEVAVDHGLVEVYQIKDEPEKDSAPALKASLDAGDVLTIADEQPQLIEYDLDEMEDRLAWRDGMIVINDKTLDYVINEFGRYSEQKVLLADRAMGEIRVAGYFRLGDVDALLLALEKNFKIRSEYYQDNDTFVLSQIPQPAS